MPNPTQCGYVVIIGRTGVGKSTLVHRLMGAHKVPHIHTERQTVIGVTTQDNVQIVYVDIPALYIKALQYFNLSVDKKTAHILAGTSVIILVVEPPWRSDDEWILKQLKEVKSSMLSLFLVINTKNKVISDTSWKSYIAQVSNKFQFKEIISLCAKTDSLSNLEQKIKAHLPHSPFFFPQPDPNALQLLTQISNIIRDNALDVFKNEIDYAIPISVLPIHDSSFQIKISAILWTNNPTETEALLDKKQKKIKALEKLVKKELHEQIEKDIRLRIRVQIKSEWLDNAKLIHHFRIQ